MADIEVTFEGDDGPLRGVIGRLSKELINFAKRSEAAFGDVQSAIEGVGRAGTLSERALERQRKQLEALQKVSRFETTSPLGFDVSQIRKVQAALSSSTRQASDLSKEFSGQNQFLRDQVAQYERVLQRQRQINDLAGQRKIEGQAAPQSTSEPTNVLGLTAEQIARIQAALAQSTNQARELTAEFIRQNAAVSSSQEIVARQGSDIKKFGKESSKSFKNAAKGALLLAEEFGVVDGEIIDVGNSLVKVEDDIIDAEIVTKNLGEEISKSGNSIKATWSGLFSSLGDQDLPALRYALYDIGNNLTRIGVGLSALGIAPLVIAANYQKEFANVIRTNELARDDVSDLRNSLRKDLQRIAQSTPIPWEDITNIATLAGQLGIAQESVGAFTETVAKFSATTNLTVDAASTAFGRLNQLIDGVDGNFDNLGSAILAVGVDSVATESEIVNVATQIASMGNLAGLTAAEIVGLSGAISSLGIRPELARGTITRLFTKIGTAANSGGQRVEEFGRLTGRTADQFAEDWGSEPGAVLQDFFDGINQEGPEAERTLRSLSITSVRDIPAILRLAQSSDEVRRLIRLSTEEYIRGNEVTEQYGVVAGTVSAQIARLGQNFELLQASIGQSVTLLSGLIGVLNLVVQGYNAIVDNPVGAAFSGVFIAVSLLAGGMALLVAQAAFVAAAVLAVTFVMRKLGINLKFTELRQLFFKGSLEQTRLALFQQAAATAQSSAAFEKYAISLQKATVGAKLFRGVLRSLLITTGIGAVFVAVTAAIGFFVEKSQQATEQVENLFGSLEGLTEALVADGAAFDEQTKKMKDGTDAFAVYRKNLDETNDNLIDYAEASDAAVNGQDDLSSIIKNTNDALEKQEELLLVAGDQVLQYFKDSALRNEDLVRIFGSPQFLQAAEDSGVEVAQLFENGLQGIDADEALGPVLETLEERLAQLYRDRGNVGRGRGSDAEAQRIQKDIEELEEIIKSADDVLIPFLDNMETTVETQVELANGTETLNSALETNVELTTLLRDNISALNKELFADAKFVKDVEDSLEGLAKGFAENATEAQLASGAIGKSVQAILNEPEGNVDIILGNLSGLLSLLEAQGPETAAAQAFVRKAIEEVGGEANLQTPNIFAYAEALNATANFDAENFANLVADAMEKVASSTKGATEEVKTLTEQFEELFDAMFEPINTAQDQAESIIDLGESYGELGKNALYASEEVQDAVRAIGENAKSPEQAVANLEALFGELARTVGSETDPSLQFLRNSIDRVAQNFGIAASEVAGFADVDLSSFEDGIKQIQEEVRTLSDYSSDLEDIIGRAFDIRYSDVLQIDSIAGAWENLGEQVNEARESIEELRASQQDLSADRAIKEYFLSVAESYGDELRAAKLRAEIAEIDRKRAENQREIQAAEEATSGILEGTSEAARRNRGELIDLISEYQQYITTLAESGASQDELREATEKARAEFIEQATELGFQESVVLEYAEAFDDVTTAIDNVPRDITVDADTDPAIQALNELNAKLEDSIDLAGRLNQVTGSGLGNLPARTGPTRPTRTQPTSETTSSSSDPRFGNQQSVNSVKSTLSGLRSSKADTESLIITLQGALSDATPEDQKILRRRIDDLKARVRSITSSINQTQTQLRQLGVAPGNFADGGFTGRGGKYDPAGIVHRGEFVVPQNMVNQSTGLPDASFLAAMQNGVRSYSDGGFVGGASANVMMVELSPADRQLLRDSGGSGDIIVSVDSKEIARASNRGNQSLASGGYRP